MKAVIWTIFVSAALLIVTGVLFVYSGTYDVAAVHPDSPLVARLVHTVSDRSIAAHLDEVTAPAALDTPENAAAGAKLYGETCVVCHGAPGLKPSGIAQGLNPAPPDLFRAGRDPDPKEDFWFISNGVKMTGMPGFSKSLGADQIWSLVAFLKTAPGMSAADFAAKTGVALAAAPAPAPAPAAGASAAAASAPPAAAAQPTPSAQPGG